MPPPPPRPPSPTPRREYGAPTATEPALAPAASAITVTDQPKDCPGTEPRSGRPTCCQRICATAAGRGEAPPLLEALEAFAAEAAAAPAAGVKHGSKTYAAPEAAPDALLVASSLPLPSPLEASLTRELRVPGAPTHNRPPPPPPLAKSTAMA